MVSAAVAGTAATGRRSRRQGSALSPDRYLARRVLAVRRTQIAGTVAARVSRAAYARCAPDALSRDAVRRTQIAGTVATRAACARSAPDALSRDGSRVAPMGSLHGPEREVRRQHGQR